MNEDSTEEIEIEVEEGIVIAEIPPEYGRITYDGVTLTVS